MVSSVGLGHVVRSYRIARYLKSKGFKINWITSEPCITYLKAKNENICDVSYELKSICNLAEKFLSGYRINFRMKYLKEEIKILKENASKLSEFPFDDYDIIVCDEFYEIFFLKDKIERAIYITDFVKFPNNFLFPLSFILNDFLKKYFYKIFKYKFFAGIREELEVNDFIPIGYIPSFDKVKVPERDEFSILITFGGTSVGKYVIKDFIKHLRKIDCKILIATGPRIELKDISDENIEIISFTTELYKYIACANIVITSGGYSTMSDLLYLKKPTIIYPIKGHFEQINRAKILQKITNHVFILKKIENIYDVIEKIKYLKNIKGLPKSYFNQYKRIYNYVINML